MPTRYDPAHKIIRKFGGVKRISDQFRCNMSNISRWHTDPGRGGYGGRVPSHYHVRLLRWAREADIPLSFEELLESPRPAPGETEPSPAEAAG